jgi:hypothetical protein
MIHKKVQILDIRAVAKHFGGWFKWSLSGEKKIQPSLWQKRQKENISFPLLYRQTTIIIFPNRKGPNPHVRCRVCVYLPFTIYVAKFGVGPAEDECLCLRRLYQVAIILPPIVLIYVRENFVILGQTFENSLKNLCGCTCAITWCVRVCVMSAN